MAKAIARIKSSATRCVKISLCRVSPAYRRKLFVRTWAQSLADSAALYNGLYAGLARAKDGTSRAPQKTLAEWYDRTRFRWKDEAVNFVSDQTLKPAIDRARAEECAEWAGLLLASAERAGIVREAADALTLDESNANAYVEWNGEELYVGDRVEVKSPAWYQNGRVVEQGSCTLISGEA